MKRGYGILIVVGLFIVWIGAALQYSVKVRSQVVEGTTFMDSVSKPVLQGYFVYLDRQYQQREKHSTLGLDNPDCYLLDEGDCTENQWCYYDIRGGNCNPSLYLDLPDAGWPCTRSSQCISECIITDRVGHASCAAEMYFYGCYDYYDEERRRVNICVD